MNIFEYAAASEGSARRPLAERMRPVSLDEFVGQQKIAGADGLIRLAVKQDRLFSMIMWGPPGCGKTTLARIISSETRAHFIHFSAVLAGIKDIRAVIKEAGEVLAVRRKRTILFVDEIHRFSKNQQDAFLHHVESGLLTLIGATTENPSFEVIPPLLSRCRVIILEQLSPKDIGEIIGSALRNSEKGLGQTGIELTDGAIEYLAHMADGDARAALNGLEIAASLMTGEQNGHRSKDTAITIHKTDLEKILQEKALLYDKNGEEHFNLISAFHKSMRGSDPDAALYWLARMLMAGEDPLYVARRMIRFATEDIGNADPYALKITLDAAETYRFLGSPEGELALSQAAVYLATAPKSNSIYVAHNNVREIIRKTGSLPVPFHIRNAPTGLMKELGYGRGYRYAHDFEGAYTPQEYLPDKLAGQRFYLPREAGFEKTIRKRLERWRSADGKASGNREGPAVANHENET